MMDEKINEHKEGDVNPDKLQEITFKYLKSNFYRVIHSNGAFGGITGRGEIHIGFYSERLEFPDSSTIVISPTGTVVPEKFEGGGKPVREVEADVVVDLMTARHLRAWLDNKISVLEALVKDAQEEAATHANETTIPKA